MKDLLEQHGEPTTGTESEKVKRLYLGIKSGKIKMNDDMPFLEYRSLVAYLPVLEEFDSSGLNDNELIRELTIGGYPRMYKRESWPTDQYGNKYVFFAQFYDPSTQNPKILPKLIQIYVHPDPSDEMNQTGQNYRNFEDLIIMRTKSPTDPDYILPGKSLSDLKKEGVILSDLEFKSLTGNDQGVILEFDKVDDYMTEHEHSKYDTFKIGGYPVTVQSMDEELAEQGYHFNNIFAGTYGDGSFAHMKRDGTVHGE